ncbi:MAG: hypothetical protein SFU83_19830, partial [Meiothermus sp.]|nr:hypothetical protein [Meiothermus sp.]
MTNEQLTAKLSTLEALTLTAVSHPLADEELRLASLSCLTYFKGFVAATLRLDSSHYNAIAGNDLEAPIEHLSGWL